MNFKKGDFIRSKNPYEGESEYMVIDYDMFEGEVVGYKCAIMKGKHSPENDFKNSHIIHLTAEHFYQKVG